MKILADNNTLPIINDGPDVLPVSVGIGFFLECLTCLQIYHILILEQFSMVFTTPLMLGAEMLERIQPKSSL